MLLFSLLSFLTCKTVLSVFSVYTVIHILNIYFYVSHFNLEYLVVLLCFCQLYKLLFVLVVFY